MRRSRRAQRTANKYWIGGALALLVAVGVGGGVFYYSTSNQPARLDALMCPNTGPTGHFVLLVDKTDPLNFTQKQAFAARLKDLVEKRIPRGNLLSIFTLGNDFKVTAEPLLELCNPGAGEGKSEYTANLNRLRTRYEQHFRDPLLALSEELAGKHPAVQSPILEMLQLVGINGFQKRNVSGVRRLIVVSDMLHHTPQYSMYSEQPDFSTFETTAYARKSLPVLKDVEVELHYLMNRPLVQTRRNVKFWEDLFHKAGARLVQVSPIEG